MSHRKRRKRRKSSRSFSVEGYGRFKYKEAGFDSATQVKSFLSQQRINFRLIKHLEGEGETQIENGKVIDFNCNTVFYSYYLPENRRVTAYWDYENKLLYY